jgi:5-methylcytosine-specific restriction endonuclease McrA
MAGERRSSQRYRSARDQFLGVARQAGAPCWLCGKKINYQAQPQASDAFELDHALPLSTHPELEFDQNNFRAAHSSCNRSRGDTAIAVAARGKAWVQADW